MPFARVRCSSTTVSAAESRKGLGGSNPPLSAKAVRDFRVLYGKAENSARAGRAPKARRLFLQTVNRAGVAAKLRRSICIPPELTGVSGFADIAASGIRVGAPVIAGLGSGGG